MTEFLMNEAYLAELGHRVDTDGFDIHATDIARLAGLARWFEVVPAATAILTDTSAPFVPRSRAFAIVTAAVVRAQAASEDEPAVLAIAGEPTPEVDGHLEPMAV